MKKIITTVGTSLLKNYLENNSDIATNYQSIKDKSYSAYDDEKRRIKKIKEKLLPFTKNANSCAELTSIMKLKEKYKDIEIYLIATDTIESVLICEVLKEVLEEKNISVVFEAEKNTIRKLQIKDNSGFEIGLKNLIAKFHEISNNKYDDVVLNITGGYKVIIPYLTMIGEILEIPIYYIFENSNELILVPQLPIGFDDKIADLYLSYLDKESLVLINKNQEVKEKLQSYGFINANKKVTLTPLGELFRDYMNYKKTYLGVIIEFLIADLFMVQGINPEKGKTYTYVEANEERTGEIDLIIEKENEIEFFEIKSLGAYKEKQLKRHIEELIVKDTTSKKRVLTILFYLLEENFLNKKKATFKNINKIATDNNIEFRVKYIVIQPDNFQEFVRKFKENEIKDFNYNN